MEQGKPIWITGARGLIGSHIVQNAPAGYAKAVRPVTRSDFDLVDFKAVERHFQSEAPALVIHCAAISRGPDCEKDPRLARQINFEATKFLSQLFGDRKMIFFSTDLVFDGKKGFYVESDEPNPLSIYAGTKVAAEKAVLANPNHVVIRTSLNAGRTPRGTSSFTEEMRNAWRAGKSLKLFVDEFRCPIHARVTAAAIWDLVEKYEPGIYHLAGSERLSRYEIGERLAAISAGVNPRIEAGSLRDYSGPPRSTDTSLDCTKLQRLLSFPLPKFSEWLHSHPNEF